MHVLKAGSLKEGMVGSCILHLALATLILLKHLVLPSAFVPYVPTLRVDLVDLPDLTRQEMEHIRHGEKASKEKNQPTPADLILNKRVKRQEKILGALDRIKALSRVENEIEAPEKIKGNQISKGTVLSGEAKEQAEPSYYDQVLEKVRANWSLPVWIARQGLSAQILLRIGPDGVVQQVQFVKSSGNASFDNAVLEAIRSSQPFPPPSADFQPTVSKNGILLGFPL